MLGNATSPIPSRDLRARRGTAQEPTNGGVGGITAPFPMVFGVFGLSTSTVALADTRGIGIPY